VSIRQFQLVILVGLFLHSFINFIKIFIFSKIKKDPDRKTRKNTSYVLISYRVFHDPEDLAAQPAVLSAENGQLRYVAGQALEHSDKKVPDTEWTIMIQGKVL
jgi:hypothetical protein